MRRAREMQQRAVFPGHDPREDDNQPRSSPGSSSQSRQHPAYSERTIRQEQEVPDARSEGAAPSPQAHGPSEKNEYHKPPESTEESTGSSGGIFETLFKDKERTLILGLLLLLMDEKTDNSLVMALLYLLL